VNCLKSFIGKDTIVVAIPKGGVIVGYEIAQAFDLPLEMTLNQEIGHQLNKHFAIGTVGLNSRAISWASNISMDYLEKETLRIQTKLLETYFRYTGRKEPYSLSGKTVIISDDTVVSGNSMLTTIRLIQKNNPLKIIAAAPAVTKDSIDKISKQVHEFVYLKSINVPQCEKEMCPNFTDIGEEEIMHIFRNTIH
jgi:putative phosphoribosyl transferase